MNIKYLNFNQERPFVENMYCECGAEMPRAPPAHPRTSVMVKSAVKKLDNPKGSSLKCIKKYITANYKIDSEKYAKFIKKYMNKALETGELIQTTGRGAAGSVKLPGQLNFQ